MCMEMPTPCENCDELFDLNDGKASPRRNRRIVICAKCANEEEEEIEREEEIRSLHEEIGDAEHSIKSANERLRELGVVVADQQPVDMLLYCPECFEQHIDKPQPDKNWDNPPHRSHECQVCDHVWRPADVPTNGVTSIKTKGQRDGFTRSNRR